MCGQTENQQKQNLKNRINWVLKSHYAFWKINANEKKESIKCSFFKHYILFSYSEKLSNYIKKQTLNNVVKWSQRHFVYGAELMFVLNFKTLSRINWLIRIGGKNNLPDTFQMFWHILRSVYVTFLYLKMDTCKRDNTNTD